MTDEDIIKKVKEAIIDMDLETAKNVCENALNQGIKPFDIIKDGIGSAVKKVGDLFETKEYFLSELIMAGEIITQIMQILKPYIKSDGKAKAKVVLGTAKGDMHDIGKNIVRNFMQAEGFEVIDLGVDVPTDRFIEAIRVEKPQILAISVLISASMPEVEKVMKALNKEGLREKVKVVIGGAPVTQQFVDDIGADGYANDAIDGINICKRWAQE
ncbi:MAG: cobalamin-binding protein [Candidatus Lokiarchaeota archaeon]|nr:cobalamin-binding protein [Candidatus Lokiarchaeota archaeon]MBD3201064.1 cobalamin-binding protein [Candidatus Lokiarchaeota archaeon]